MRVAVPILILLVVSCERPTPPPGAPPSARRPEGDFLSLSLKVVGEARVGRPVVFSLRVTNVSKQEVQAVGCIDGSDTGLRYPVFEALIEGPKEKFFGFLSDASIPGRFSRLRREDLVALKPGESFDPWTGSGYKGHRLHQWTPKEPGRYRLHFAIDYAGPDPTQWNPDEDAVKVAGLLEKIPLQRLEESIDFDVVP